MKAIQLDGIEGLRSLKVVELERPRPGENEVLIEVKLQVSTLLNWK